MSGWRVADPNARLTDHEAAEAPRETTFVDAAASANFVVHEPTALPDDCAVETVTYRPEQPPGRPDGVDAADIGQTPWSDGNPSSVRAVVRGDGRALRIKQFLYDWAPPAAGIAPLWRTPVPTPVDCGDAVGWLGTDYEDRRGGCLQRERAQIELSVTDGAFDDDELATVLRGFVPADPAASRGVRAAPFHALHYWVRFGCRPPAVPHGLWDYSGPRPYDESRPVSMAGLSCDPIARPLVPAGDDAFLLDSALAFPDADAVEGAPRHLTFSVVGPPGGELPLVFGGSRLDGGPSGAPLASRALGDAHLLPASGERKRPPLGHRRGRRKPARARRSPRTGRPVLRAPRADRLPRHRRPLRRAR